MQDDCLDLGVLDRGWMLELQVVEHSPLDPTIHACLWPPLVPLLSLPTRGPCHAPLPLPLLLRSPPTSSGRLFGQGVSSSGGRALGAAAVANQSDAFDSEQPQPARRENPTGATGSMRRHDTTTRRHLPLTLTPAQKRTSQRPTRS